MAGENDNWEFYRDKKDEHRWRRRASNTKIVAAATEGYSSKSGATENAERHGYSGNPNGRGKNDSWEFYKDKKGEHRWRRRATSNNKIVGSSCEGYSSSSGCRDNAKRNGYSG